MNQNPSKATRIAITSMVAFLMKQNGLSRVGAYQLSSIAADPRITHLVDGNAGVHTMFPKLPVQK